MATSETNNTDLAYADTLWKSADALRGQVDAAEYKHVVLGLLFLKYISDSLRGPPRRAQGRTGEGRHQGRAARKPARKPRRVHRRARLLGAARGALAEPPEPGHAPRHRHADRRRHPRRRARQPEPQGQAPARLRPPRHRAGEDEGADRPDRRHRLQGRPRQGPRHARPRLRILPRQVRRSRRQARRRVLHAALASSALLVEMLEPYEGRVYDPCCGSGGMFVQSEKFVEAHGGNTHRHLDLRPGVQPDHLAAGAHEPRHPRHRGQPRRRSRPTRSSATCTPTSRPTSSSPIRRSTSRDWSGQLLRGRRALALRRRRPSATPTTPGSSTSSTTSPAPTAAAAAWPASSWPTARSPATPAARARSASKIVEADLVDCIVALPAQLFFTTGIPVCLWFLTRDKTGKNLQGTASRDRKGETLFIDARKLGTMQTRTLRVLTGSDDGECVADGMGDPLPDVRHRPHRLRLPPVARRARARVVERRRSTASGPTATSPASASPRRSTRSGSTASSSPPAATSAPKSRKTTANRSRRSTRGWWRSWRSALAEGERLMAVVRERLGEAFAR